MKKYTILFFIFLSVLTSLTAYGQVDRTPRIGTFDSVSIRIPAQTIIVRGREESLDIDMSDNTARKVDIYNDRGTLVIKSKSGTRVRRSDAIKIRITMPYWNSLSLSASGSLRSNDVWSSDEANIKITGSCDITLGTIESRSTAITLSGSGNLILKKLESRDSQTINSTGSGDILIQDMSSDRTEIKITGSGDMGSTLETDHLEARLTGSGSLKVSGHANLADLQSTGSGGINGSGLRADEANVKITGSGDVYLHDDSHIREIRMTGSGVFRSR